MTHLKLLFSLVAVAAALTALTGAGNALAETTELYTGHATDSTGSAIATSLTSGTSLLSSDTSGELAYTCKKSAFAGKTTNTTATPLTMNIESLTWGDCTFTTKTVANGSLDITYVGDKNGDGQGDGTVTGTGTEWTNLVFGFIDCIYGTGAGTHLGTLSGSTAGHASLAINATIYLLSGGFGCPETTKLVPTTPLQPRQASTSASSERRRTWSSHPRPPAGGRGPFLREPCSASRPALIDEHARSLSEESSVFAPPRRQS